MLDETKVEETTVTTQKSDESCSEEASYLKRSSGLRDTRLETNQTNPQQTAIAATPRQDPSKTVNVHTSYDLRPANQKRARRNIPPSIPTNHAIKNDSKTKLPVISVTTVSASDETAAKEIIFSSNNKNNIEPQQRLHQQRCINRPSTQLQDVEMFNTRPLQRPIEEQVEASTFFEDMEVEKLYDNIH
jgi:hypothetical protein